MKRITYALKPKRKRLKPAGRIPSPKLIVTAKPPKQIDAYKRLLRLRAETVADLADRTVIGAGGNP